MWYFRVLAEEKFYLKAIDNISWQSAFLKNKSVGLFVESVFFKGVFHLGLSVGDRESDYISWELVSFKIVFYESVFFKIVLFECVFDLGCRKSDIISWESVFF